VERGSIFSAVVLLNIFSCSLRWVALKFYLLDGVEGVDGLGDVDRLATAVATMKRIRMAET
jgi:hypothetical protein